MTPRSQKDRPISFLLMTPDGIEAEQDLVLRPEELTRQESSRNSVQQTLGAGENEHRAWVDSFGRGLPTITLSGHTGWRGTATEDGEALFRRLRDTVFTRWHSLRAEFASKLRDPNDVQLVLADQLDDFAVVISPQQFQLRRHKSRPLLSQFQISLIDLGDYGSKAHAYALQDQIVDAIHNPARTQLATDALGHNVKNRIALANELTGLGLSDRVVQASIAIMELTNQLLNYVASAARGGARYSDAITGPVLALSVAVSQAAANAFAIMAMPSNLATHVKLTLMRIAANFLDAYCNLRNGWQRLLTFPSFDDLFGASMCSSTGGGRPYSPWAQENPYLAVFPATSPIVNATPQALGATEMLAGVDPVNNNYTQSAVLASMEDISNGVALA